MKSLADLASGDWVKILKDGNAVGVDQVKEVTARRIHTKRSGVNYSRINGRQYAGRFHIVPTTAEAAQTLAARLKEAEEAAVLAREAEESRRIRAEYDALPEGAKLFRKLQWVFDTTDEKKFSTLPNVPIDAMRTIAEWVEKNKLETE